MFILKQYRGYKGWNCFAKQNIGTAMSKQKPHKSKRKTYGNNSAACSKAIDYHSAKTQNSSHIFHRLKTCIAIGTMLLILKDHYDRWYTSLLAT